MDLEIKIDADQINKFMAAKIMESALGDQVRKAVENRMADFNSFSSPLKPIVDQHVADMIRAALNTPEFKAKIEIAISKFLTESKIQQLAENFVERLEFKTGY